ncbi:MAG: FAD-dependent monooxygenase [Actinobacteria bacterium]|nr:FAD-dependent monooxygenase [Actinomycetota bacterium]MCB8997229.1 FAD-dependent monooxygenase [Actinomycetota bacterium]MCB9414631.1 FAD-dependent monooxygenase [Actinomycetota bacterium]MCB9423541.1 FAD-dependent monooxygenase [Actinomycetota bacterium]HRY09043.1 FAD-dependent monooxygenase [Candidatus Nanopelagicales bacterium]
MHIIGGGIGGLSLALALHRVGVPARVYEQAPTLEPVGAGIGLWPGALQGLRTLGVAQWFWDLPVCPFRWAETATPDGRTITGFDVSGITGGQGYVVRRADLHRALYEQLPDGAVVTGKQLVGLAHDPDGVDLSFADGSTERADTVVGADGLRSVVRTALVGAHDPRYSGETAYRGIAAVAVEDLGMMRETQGIGWRGAVHPLDAEHVYWWAARRVPAGQMQDPHTRKQTVLGGVEGWVGGLPEAVTATPAEAILHNDLYDRDPLATWTVGRVSLLGDAAHPTTPNLGLGGCMAIEDAVVLGRAWAQTGAYGPAFAQYEFERHARTARVVRMSRLMGRTGSLTNPVAVKVWRSLNAVTPARVAASMLAREVSYTPGPLD